MFELLLQRMIIIGFLVFFLNVMKLMLMFLKVQVVLFIVDGKSVLQSGEWKKNISLWVLGSIEFENGFIFIMIMFFGLYGLIE